MPQKQQVCPSTWISSSGVLSTNKGLVYGVFLISGPSVDSQVSLYDGADDTETTKMFTVKAKAGDSKDLDLSERPKEFLNGLYADIGGSAAKALIWHT